MDRRPAWRGSDATTGNEYFTVRCATERGPSADWSAPSAAAGSTAAELCGRGTHGRANETDPWWIETCEKCKRYIKVLDERRLALDEETIMLVADVATLHLDLLAEREGYKRRMPYTALS